MTVSTDLKAYLDHNGVKYQVLSHAKAMTALEVAQKQAVPGQQLAKTVVVKADAKFLLAVLPCTYRVNLQELGKAMKAKEITLAPEMEFKNLFPDCELGAMSPFGGLYHMPVWVDESLTWDKEIVFNAGSHTETIKMSFKDFEKLAKPRVANFGIRI